MSKKKSVFTRRMGAGIVRALAGGAVACLLLATIGACYDYRVVERVDALAPGSAVRISLTRTGRLDLEEQTGRLSPETGGTVFRSNPDSLFLVATRATPFRPGERPRFDTLRFGRAGIGEVRRKELDRVRTTSLAVGAVAAVTAFFLWGFEVIGGGGTGTDQPDSPDRTRIPLFDRPGG